MTPGIAEASLEAGRGFPEATRQEPGSNRLGRFRSIDDPDIIDVEIPDRDGWDETAEV